MARDKKTPARKAGMISPQAMAYEALPDAGALKLEWTGNHLDAFQMAVLNTALDNATRAIALTFLIDVPAYQPFQGRQYGAPQSTSVPIRAPTAFWAKQ